MNEIKFTPKFTFIKIQINPYAWFCRSSVLLKYTQLEAHGMKNKNKQWTHEKHDFGLHDPSVQAAPWSSSTVELVADNRLSLWAAATFMGSVHEMSENATHLSMFTSSLELQRAAQTKRSQSRLFKVVSNSVRNEKSSEDSSWAGALWSLGGRSDTKMMPREPHGHHVLSGLWYLTGWTRPWVSTG